MKTVYEKQVNTNRFARVAQINNKFYPYYFDHKTGQVTSFGRWFHKGETEDAIKYVSEGYKQKTTAVNKFNR